MLLPRHIDNSRSMYLFLKFYPYLSKSAEFNNQELLEFFLLPKNNKKQSGFAWNFLKTPIRSLQSCLNPLFQRTLFLTFTLFQKKNQQNGKQCCLPPLSFNISLKDTSFHIYSNSLGLYLSPECLMNFL